MMTSHSVKDLIRLVRSVRWARCYERAEAMTQPCPECQGGPLGRSDFELSLN